MSKIKSILRANRNFLLVSLILGLAGLTIVVSKTSGLNTATTSPRKEDQKPLKTFNPNRQKSLTVESEKIAVSLEGSEPCTDCLANTSFRIEVRNKLQGTIKTATIRNETAQVDEILLNNPNRIVVLGSANGTTRTVNIIDTETGELVDSFVCTYPSLSKEGRFLAFVKSAPKFSSPEDWSYVYSVYDLGVESNRNTDAADRVVGAQVYPVENSTRKKVDSIDESTAHLLASEGLFWTDAETFAFVDRSKRVNTLVVVDLHFGIDRPKVKTRKLDTAKIVKKCGESENSPENLINVTMIRLSNGSQKTAHLTFQPMGQCLRHAELDIALD